MTELEYLLTLLLPLIILWKKQKDVIEEGRRAVKLNGKVGKMDKRESEQNNNNNDVSEVRKKVKSEINE